MNRSDKKWLRHRTVETVADLLTGDEGDTGNKSTPLANGIIARQLASYFHGPEDEEKRMYGRTRSETWKITRTSSISLESSNVEKELDETTPFYTESWH